MTNPIRFLFRRTTRKKKKRYQSKGVFFTKKREGVFTGSFGDNSSTALSPEGGSSTRCVPSSSKGGGSPGRAVQRDNGKRGLVVWEKKEGRKKYWKAKGEEVGRRQGGRLVRSIGAEDVLKKKGGKIEAGLIWGRGKEWGGRFKSKERREQRRAVSRQRGSRKRAMSRGLDQRLRRKGACLKEQEGGQ